MAIDNNIVKLAVDSYKGKVENYSKAAVNKSLREALIEVNNGSTKLNYKDIRDGKCVGLFSIIEEILNATIVDHLQNDVIYNTLVEIRNTAEGDQNSFVANDAVLFYVSEVANGTQGIKRQRISSLSEIVVPTTMKLVRIYEELNRVLSGRIDPNELIDIVAKSFNRKIADDVYSLWINATAEQLGGTSYFPAAGTYSEDALLDVIAHVEAAAGKTATILGTKKALRNLQPAIVSDSAKEDMYNLGYVGKFYGSPVVAMPQRHKIGTTEFVLDDNVLTIVATEDKPIKLVYEGNPIIIPGDPYTNADLTQEYLYGAKWGTGIILSGGNSGIGKYEIM